LKERDNTVRETGRKGAREGGRTGRTEGEKKAGRKGRMKEKRNEMGKKEGRGKEGKDFKQIDSILTVFPQHEGLLAIL
jgi:hypothetical protein